MAAFAEADIAVVHRTIALDFCIPAISSRCSGVSRPARQLSAGRITARPKPFSIVPAAEHRWSHEQESGCGGEIGPLIDLRRRACR
jgi:hypothetical protein